ncbi:hypothetical protein FHETE_5964 [Fusarium heterosporum]|uniref:Uncharacterized protein n=1 Tax=Fusarium heterosporum TaxID=42747 RepID=A0A8H5WPC8_FUSHE|nr:hypothetical protein FHETE_5964 [Fusarium heterosporum]
MSGLLSYLPFFKGKTPPPTPNFPSDDVIPVHLFDDSAAARGIVLVWTFQFEDVLNPQNLHDSLSALFDLPGWRKLGGRFRLKTNGGLEIHVPRDFSDDRPPVYFTQGKHDIPMSEHPLASKLPQPNGNIATFPGPKEFCSLGLGPGTPRNMDDFTCSDKPQFCLHVQTFTDGTLVSVSHSHVSTDLMGLASIFEAWSLVLAGKSETVATMFGYGEDVFDDILKSAPQERHTLADKVLDGWRFKYWGMRSLYESWQCSEIQSRTLCVPKSAVDKMMQQARNHLSALNSQAPIPFISEGDVFTAIACRMLARYQGQGSQRELTTIMAIDPRSRVKSVFTPNLAYVQNSPNNIFYFCRADEVSQLPLGQLALLVREAIQTQATEEQLKAATVLSVESMKATKMPVIFGDMNMAAQFMSNWTKGKLAEKMDFGAAVEREARPETRRGKRGHPIYYQASDPSHNTVSVISSVFVVMSKDYEGNTWFSNSLPTEMWSDLMEFLKQFQ